jgi:dTMP kinase
MIKKGDNMAGYLIILEGGDACGKATQTKLLHEHLQKDGEQVRSVSFPDYDSPSSTLVKMYLGGAFGKDADAINPYAASTFYAVDRFASYQMKWKTFFKEGGIILADRYTTSNMLYQMIKFNTTQERQTYLQWLCDLEFYKMGLPVPDLVILLDMPLQVSEKLMSQRKGKTGGRTGDIHEKNREFLTKCHHAYHELAKTYGWQKIDCTKGEELRSPDDIHLDIYTKVKALLRKQKNTNEII